MTDIPTTGPPPESPPQPQSPTTTAYQQLADQFLRDLDQISGIIPRQEISDLSSRRHVRSHLNVNRQFVELVVASVEQTPELKATNQLDTVVARDGLQYLDAFQPVLNKLESAEASLRFFLQAVKAKLVVTTQRMYHITKGVARDPEKPEVAKRAALMKQTLGRRGPTQTRVGKEPETPKESGAPPKEQQ